MQLKTLLLLINLCFCVVVQTRTFSLLKKVGQAAICSRCYSQLAIAGYCFESIQSKRKVLGLPYQLSLNDNAPIIAILQSSSHVQHKTATIKISTRNAVLSSVVLVMVLAGLIYRCYSIGFKCNKLLQQQQSEMDRQNERLKKFTCENEWLLKEIHHRVKNNLQIVISLLNAQSAYLENEDALNAIRNSQHRMHALSLIHRRLYQTEEVGTIEISAYIHELADYLNECLNLGRDIAINIDAQPLQLAASQAVPLGLILNEAITNSIKYAFNDTKNGRIDIVLEPADDGRHQLCIADNGRGLPQAFDPYDTGSLGMSLMLGLSQQLEGDFYLENENGLRLCVTFRSMKFNNLEQGSS